MFQFVLDASAEKNFLTSQLDSYLTLFLNDLENIQKGQKFKAKCRGLNSISEEKAIFHSCYIWNPVIHRCQFYGVRERMYKQENKSLKQKRHQFLRSVKKQNQIFGQFIISADRTLSNIYQNLKALPTFPRKCCCIFHISLLHIQILYQANQAEQDKNFINKLKKLIYVLKSRMTQKQEIAFIQNIVQRQDIDNTNIFYRGYGMIQVFKLPDLIKFDLSGFGTQLLNIFFFLMINRFYCKHLFLIQSYWKLNQMYFQFQF
ncbi:unnamed protein product [Paramecium octaurelia]|uniref:Uncharacterized protein n=1 Tax=Paramecium octaurelia TaxID=43137 RepID=A0A8S1XCW9_PAROT|nr:unnamed protein product [Paramecium octaurelia]